MTTAESRRASRDRLDIPTQRVAPRASLWRVAVMPAKPRVTRDHDDPVPAAVAKLQGLGIKPVVVRFPGEAGTDWLLPDEVDGEALARTVIERLVHRMGGQPDGLVVTNSTTTNARLHDELIHHITSPVGELPTLTAGRLRASGFTGPIVCTAWLPYAMDDADPSMAGIQDRFRDTGPKSAQTAPMGLGSFFQGAPPR